MANVTHTAGPWEVSERGTVSSGIVADKFELATCYVRDWNPSSQAEAKANARLIAAAPDLLAALQLVCDSGVALADPIERAMLDAIKKASNG